jgi:hypothetical protein
MKDVRHIIKKALVRPNYPIAIWQHEESAHLATHCTIQIAIRHVVFSAIDLVVFNKTRKKFVAPLPK